jgi:carbonic anhydrase
MLVAASAQAASPLAAWATAGGGDESEEDLAGIKALTALDRLHRGNQRYMAGQPLHPRQTAQRREQIAPSQQPFATIFSCADSRVPPEIIFDQGLGDLFAIRVAGNIVNPAIMGSVEYAVEHLGTHLVVVLGHQNCGAVQAAVDLVTKGAQPNGHVPAFVNPIVPAVKLAQTMSGDLVDNAVRANVRMVTAQLQKAGPVLSTAVSKKTLSIVGARYDLHSGAVTYITPG